MKLTLIFIVMCISSIFAKESHSQSAKISVFANNLQAKEVIDQIESQTDYLFVYNNKHVDLSEKVSVNAKNTAVSEVLSDVFDDSGIAYVMEGHNILLMKKPERSEMQQDKGIITGTVADINGETIVGATVQLKGTTIGVITDFDGAFSIKADASDVFIVSFIGYLTQEITVGDDKVLNVKLEEDIKALEEVVVVGYGVQKKVNMTAAVETVDTKVLENRPVATVSQMLEGVVPNLNVTTSSGAPDAKSSLNIRGFTGMDNDPTKGGTRGGPLVLVDGVEMDLDLVNPNDIEGVSVLKDAAGSAIYGSRAPYGVILITTKSGTKGQKMSINYSGNYQINQPSMLPSSARSIDFAHALNNSQYNSLAGPVYGEDVMQRMQDYIDGKITDNNIIMSNGRWGEHWDSNSNTDYVGHAFKDFSQNTSHDVSISGGNEKTTYYTGLGYSYREGIYNTDLDKYDRYSAIVKINTEITDWLSVNFNSRYSRKKTLRPNFRGAESGSKSDESFWQNLGYFSNIPIKNPDGSYNRLSSMPILDGAGGEMSDKVDDYWLTVGTEIKPLNNFVVKGSFSWNTKSQNFDRTTLQFYVDEPNGERLRSARSSALDGLYKKSSKSNYYTFDITANYSKIIKKHDFSVLVGMQQELKQVNNLIGSLNGFYSQSLPSFSTSYKDNMSLDDEVSHWATRGYFLRATYNYDSRYLLEFNGRYDAASKYSPDTRWAFFPSVSAGWNIANEAFWNIEQISRFKVTGTYGISGDQGGGNYLYIPTLETTNMGDVVLGGERPPHVSMPGIVAPDLTWAKPQSIGFGVEVGALNNRLRGEYYWYQRTTHDQLGPADKLPEILGVNPPNTNNAVTETRGWELSISWRDKAFEIAGSPLNYNVRFILSDYIGYVVEYQDNVAGVREKAWTPGQVFGEVYGYKGDLARNKDDLVNTVLPGSDFYYSGDMIYQDLNGDGRIDKGVGETWYSMGDLTSLGHNYARLKYGINIGLSWKNFDISMLLDGVGKEVRYVNSMTVFGQTGAWSGRYQYDMHTDLGYWSMNNQDAFLPRVYQSSKNFDKANDRYLLDLSHLRIKNINIGYTCPSHISRKIGLSRLSVHFSAENLGMIYYNSWLKLDPQMLRNDGKGYPIQRTFSMGVKIGI